MLEWSGETTLVENFNAEVAAVPAREQPATAGEDLIHLQSIEWEADDWPRLYATAIELSIRLQYHLLDILYHATALHTEGATMVTSDEGYYGKAHGEGGIVRLRDFDPLG